MAATTDRPAIVACPACGAKNRVPAAAAGRPRCARCHDDLPWVAEAGDGDFSSVVAQSPVPVLLDAWAPWCGPCRMVAPVVEQLAVDLAGRLKVVKLNVDEAVRVAGSLRVQSIPALFLLDQGEVVASTVGARPYPELRRWVDAELAGRGSVV
ncbi:MAG: thioredoxin [Acidimicrobiales bacterium]|jgi:thioredoxin 2|nr:thioredoxin [Acidimicrobiales bacterium]